VVAIHLGTIPLTGYVEGMVKLTEKLLDSTDPNTRTLCECFDDHGS